MKLEEVGSERVLVHVRSPDLVLAHGPSVAHGVAVTFFRSGPVLAAAAMCCVGSSVAVSTPIIDAPLFTLQGLRYALAAIVLLVLARATGRRPALARVGGTGRGSVGVAATGLCCSTSGSCAGRPRGAGGDRG